MESPRQCTSALSTKRSAGPILTPIMAITVTGLGPLAPRASAQMQPATTPADVPRWRPTVPSPHRTLTPLPGYFPR